jgi:hypothetical protein
MVRLKIRLLLMAPLLLVTTARAGAANYGAIAYSESTGDFGFSFDYRSMDGATKRAIRECKKQSGADDCRMVQGVGSVRGGPELCAALSVLPLPGTKTTGEPTIFRWLTAETAASRKEAEAKALAGCEETRAKLSEGGDGSAAPSCELVTGVCSRGPGQ